MCAQFMIKTNQSQIKKYFGIEVKDFDLDLRVLPYKKAPVVVEKNGKMILKEMQFSLLPAWSKEPKVKFSTHNARIDGVAEKPTWKRPFLTNHALVPMSLFIEPIYENELAGNMVKFIGKDDGLLVAAAIYDEWTNKETGEVIESFAIITDEPVPFVKKVGHDRSPLFLDKKGFEKWLSPDKHPADYWLDLLHKFKEIPQLRTEIDRPLKQKK